MKNKRYSKDFGKKEKVLNYACQTYQLSRPNKVGTVMALIRECQPKSISEWEKWYFEKAYTGGKNPVKNYKRSFAGAWRKTLSAYAEDHGCKAMDECVKFSASADFAPPKQSKIPWV